MSTNDTNIDLDLQNINLETIANNLTAESNSYTIDPIENESIIEGVKKEYSIIGDGLYASINADQAPQWLTDIIDNVVSSAIASNFIDYDLLVQDVRNAIDSIDVARNTYVEQININALINGIISTRLETLNATLGDTYATRVELTTALATTDEALTLYVTDLVAAFNDSVNARVTNVETAFANADFALASSIEALNSRFITQDEDLSANASAISGIKTYVGLTPGNTPDGTGLLSRVGVLENQNDGVVEYISGTYDVMTGIQDPNVTTSDDELVTTAEPYATWIATDTANGNELVRQDHIGDVYIQYETGTGNYLRAFKFIKTAEDLSSPFATDPEGYTWSLITDTDAANALIIALQAKDLADGKRRVFVGLGATATPNPPYDVGDLWLIDAARSIDGQSAAIGDIFRAIETKGAAATYEQNDWVTASSFVTAVNAVQTDLDLWRNTTYSDFVTDISGQVDQKAESFYQEDMPRVEGTDPSLAVFVGDLWKNSNTNQEYIYQLVSGTYQWVETDIPDSVYDTIDGKKAIFVGNNLPVGTVTSPIQLNDMWITGSNPPNGYEAETIYVVTSLDPVVWTIPVKYTDDSGLIELSNGLANGTITINLDAATINGVSLSDFVANQSDNQVVVYSGNDHTEITQAKLDDLYIESVDQTAADGTVYVVVTIYKCTTGYVADPVTNCVWTAQTNASASLADLADLADGKRTIFSNVSNDVPVGEVNDLWIPKSGSNDATYVPGEVYQYNGTNWILATKYTEDLNNFIDNTYSPDSAQLHRQLDGKIEYYFFESFNVGTVPVDISSATSEAAALVLIDAIWNTPELKDSANGNIVYFKDSKNAYWYQGSNDVWLTITDTSIYQALQEAAIAKGAADGKISQFYGWKATTAPADVSYISNPEAAIGSQITEVIPGPSFLYWLKDDNNLYYNPSGTWIPVPEASGTGGIYISEGDVLTAFNPTTRDHTFYTYNGTSWQQTGPDGIISSSQFFIELSNDVRSETGLVADALSTLKIENEAYTDGEVATLSSSFSFNNTLFINGAYYNSGFGLNTAGAGSLPQPSGADGLTPATAFDSEFWINAERLVLKSPSFPSVSAIFNVTAGGIKLSVENTEATRNEPRGDYNAGTTYSKGDIVFYLGSSYSALRTTINDTPGSSPLDWQLLAAGGSGVPGLNNATVYLYRRSTSVPANPTSTSTYNFGTKVLSGFNNSWTATIPAGTNPLYVIAATASSTSSTDTIASNEWSSPVVLSSSGTNGLNSATIYLYRRATSTPALPSANITYTFSTGASTVANNSWTRGVPAGTDPIYVTTATAVSTASTDVIGPSEWATPQILARNGDNGAPGVSYTGTIEYYKLTNTTTTPTIASGGWSTTPQTPTSSNRYLWNYNSNTRSSGSPINSPVSLITQYVKDGKGIVSITEEYQRGASATTAPTGVWSSTFSGAGALTASLPYMWNRTTIAYTEGANTVTTTMIAARGSDGSPGSTGAGFYGATYSTASTIQSTITSRFITLVGRSPVTGDVFVQKEASNNTVVSRQYNASNLTWSVPALAIDGSIIATGTIGADQIVSNAIQARHLQISGGSSVNGSRRSFRINPDDERPIYFATLNDDNSVKENIFYIDAEGNAFLNGKLSKNTVDIDAIQQEARSQINPYYIGTGNGIRENTTLQTSTAGQAFNTQLTAVDVFDNKVNISYKLNASAFTISGTFPNYTAPVWQVIIRRDSVSGPIVSNRTYTGIVQNSTEPLGNNAFIYDAFSVLNIEDSVVDTAVGTSRDYWMVVTRVSGTPTTITRQLFRAESPSFRPIEMELEYTSLFYSASGQFNGTITLSESLLNYQFVAVSGSDTARNTMDTKLIPVASLLQDYQRSFQNDFMLYGVEGAAKMRVSPNTAFTSLVTLDQAAYIFRISGVNIIEKGKAVNDW